MERNTDIQVVIPKQILLTLAVYGNMGDGELPKIMQVWAERECLRVGLSEEVRLAREERYLELKRRVRNVVGSDVIGKLEVFGETLYQAMSSGNKHV